MVKYSSYLFKEILFRDGVPLNEHFLALKTKYTNEKNAFEVMVEVIRLIMKEYEK